MVEMVALQAIICSVAGLMAGTVLDVAAFRVGLVADRERQQGNGFLQRGQGFDR